MCDTSKSALSNLFERQRIQFTAALASTCHKRMILHHQVLNGEIGKRQMENLNLENRQELDLTKARQMENLNLENTDKDQI